MGAHRSFGRRLLVRVVAITVLVASCAGTEAADDPAPATQTPASQPGPESEPVLEPEAVPETEPIPEPEPAPETEPVLEPEAEPESEPSVEPEPVPDTEPPRDAEPEPERDFAEVSARVAAFVDENGLNGAGLAVVHRDAGVVHEEYWGEIGPDRASLIASSTKQIVAGVMFRLQEEGLLDIDAPLPEVIGDAWGPGLGDITVSQLVSNSSGLVGPVADPPYFPYICQFLTGEELESCGATIATTPDDDGDVVAPDTEFRYGGGQWQVAGAVAEHVSGESFAGLLERIYFEPCGLSDNTGINNHWMELGGDGTVHPPDFDGDLSLLTPTENPQMEGGMYSTVPDYAQLLLMHLRGGECPGGRVLSPSSLARMHTDRAAEWGGYAGTPNRGYGYGWWHNRETGRIADPGAYGAVPWLDLDDGYGAFLLLEASLGTGMALQGEIAELVHDAVTGQR